MRISSTSLRDIISSELTEMARPMGDPSAAAARELMQQFDEFRSQIAAGPRGPEYDALARAVTDQMRQTAWEIFSTAVIEDPTYRNVIPNEMAAADAFGMYVSEISRIISQEGDVRVAAKIDRILNNPAWRSTTATAIRALFGARRQRDVLQAPGQIPHLPYVRSRQAAAFNDDLNEIQRRDLSCLIVEEIQHLREIHDTVTTVAGLFDTDAPEDVAGDVDTLGGKAKALARHVWEGHADYLRDMSEVALHAVAQRAAEWAGFEAEDVELVADLIAKNLAALRDGKMTLAGWEEE